MLYVLKYREIEKAWKMVDMTAEREERARETIETLNTEIQNLTKVRLTRNYRQCSNQQG